LSLQAISLTYPEDGDRIFLRDVGVSLPNRSLLSEILYAVFISAVLPSFLSPSFDEWYERRFGKYHGRKWTLADCICLHRRMKIIMDIYKDRPRGYLIYLVVF
jgi:hypothetical protein